MNELQLQKTVKPTSVRVPQRTKLWLKEKMMTVSSLVRYGPSWYDRMVEIADENRELQENIKAAQVKLAKLTEDNLELMKFKERTTRRIKTEGVPN